MASISAQGRGKLVPATPGWELSDLVGDYEKLARSLDEWRRMGRWLKKKGRPAAPVAPAFIYLGELCALCGEGL